MPPICASASTMSTPGHDGPRREVPLKPGLAHRHALVAERCARRAPRRVTRSTRTNGHRCGRICRMRSISIVVVRLHASPGSASSPDRGADERRGRASPARAATAPRGTAGYPATIAPGGTSPMTPLFAGDARAVADRDVVGDRRPGRRRAPRGRASPSRRSPHCAATMRPSPMSPLWPTCTCASSLAPRRTRVGESVPASIVQSGPIDTSSSMTTPPSCGTARTAPAGPAGPPEARDAR